MDYNPLESAMNNAQCHENQDSAVSALRALANGIENGSLVAEEMVQEASSIDYDPPGSSQMYRFLSGGILYQHPPSNILRWPQRANLTEEVS